MDVRQLWNSRCMGYWEIAMRYLRIIANSGLLFTVYVLIIIGSYYYRHFLDWLPANFPVLWIFVIISTFLLTRGLVRTFMKEGDLVFLLPMEGRMQVYFRKSIIYSVIFQSFTMVVILFLLTPLYLERINPSFQSFLIVLFFLILAKSWNLLCSFEEQRSGVRKDKMIHLLLRAAINAVYTFFLFHPNGFIYLFFILVVMFVLYYSYYRHFHKKYSIKWDDLLSVENQKLVQFFKIANLFTDVPMLKGSVKKRSWANIFLQQIRFHQKYTFDYLYTRAFIRTNDYFGIYIRLFMVGSIFLLVLPDGVIRSLVYFLFIFLSGMQLSTLWKHFQTSALIDMYPLSITDRRKSFSRVVFMLLGTQSIFLIVLLVVLGTWSLYDLLLVPIGILFSYVYSFQWIHRKLKAS